jgi:manganese transport protein
VDVPGSAEVRQRLLRGTRLDVGLAMAVAGAVNIAMVLTAAAALQGRGTDDDSIAGAHHALSEVLGPSIAVAFAVALLASGLASSAVGTYAGAVVFEGFWRRHVPVYLRRAVTMTPAIVLLSIGIEPTRALILSQVVLSFGIPFVLFPLVRMTSDATLMRELVNRKATAVAGMAVAIAVTVLNAVLVGLILNP